MSAEGPGISGSPNGNSTNGMQQVVNADERQMAETMLAMMAMQQQQQQWGKAGGAGGPAAHSGPMHTFTQMQATVARSHAAAQGHTAIQTPVRQKAPSGSGSSGGGLQLHDEIASLIGTQVEHMIMKAKDDSERKVRNELVKMREMTDILNDKIEKLYERMAARPTGDTVDRNSLGQLLQKIEHRWGKELATLKQELHQTILAHNHNADLMRHHKDALDHLRTQLEQKSVPHVDQIHSQLAKVDQLLQQDGYKQRKLDALMQWVDMMEAQAAGAYAALRPGPPAPGFNPGAPPFLPGTLGITPGPPGIPLGPGVSTGLAALDLDPSMSSVRKGHGGIRGGGKIGGKAENRKQHQEQHQVVKVVATVSSSVGSGGSVIEADAGSAHLRAEAPIFVPTTSQALHGTTVEKTGLENANPVPAKEDAVPVVFPLSEDESGAAFASEL